MKKIFYFFTILLLAIFTQTLTTSNVGGKSSNTTSCGSCHGNTANMNTTISYTLDGCASITSYIPGKMYAVVMTLSNTAQTGTPKGGFTLSFSKGTISGHNTAEAAISGTKLYHKTAKALAGGSVSYSFNWTAPAAGSGVVTVGTVGNVVNGNGTDDVNDQWNYFTFDLTEKSTTIPDTAKLSISVSPGSTITNKTSVTYTATPVNGGTSPTYQWKKNGTNISGATSSTYTSATLITNDKITCTMTSSLCGIIGSPVTSNQITMTVNWGANISSNQANQALEILNTSDKNVFKLSAESKTQVEIYNLNGAKVYSKSIQNNESIDLNHLNRGTYIAKMGEVTKKLVIE